MRVDNILKTALEPLGLPVSEDTYKGKLQEYIVFNYADERDDQYADDEAQTDITWIQIHYFSKADTEIVQKNKQKIRGLLRLAEFYNFSTQQFYEKDAENTHVVIECCINGTINKEEYYG